MTKKSTCDWCKRTLSRSKMRRAGVGELLRCDPKGGYKNAIECLHIYDEEVFTPDDSRVGWIQPADMVSFGAKEIEKADRWFAEGHLDEHEHRRLVWYIKEVSQ